MVTIFVGNYRKPFYVHEEQLCEVSSFFKAAFTSQFRESWEKTMDLVEEDEDTFDVFIQWLYSQQYEMPEQKTGDSGFVEPVKLFVLAEKFDISKLKTLLMTKMFARGQLPGSRPPRLSAVVYAYEHTPTSSTIRKLLADWYAYKVPIHWFHGDLAKKWFLENPDIMRDVMLNFVNDTSRQHQQNPFAGDMPKEYKDEESEPEK